MSTQALFKKLTAGIKFDTKKFSAEACKFGLTQKTEQEGVGDDDEGKKVEEKDNKNDHGTCW